MKLVQPRKKTGLDHADYTAPTRQYELGHTDEESISPQQEVRIDDLAVCQ